MERLVCFCIYYQHGFDLEIELLKVAPNNFLTDFAERMGLMFYLCQVGNEVFEVTTIRFQSIARGTPIHQHGIEELIHFRFKEHIFQL